MAWLLRKGSLRRAFVLNLVSGIRFLGPLAALFAVLKLISVWMNHLVDRLPDAINPYHYWPNAPGVGLVVLIVLLVVLGWVIRKSTDTWFLRIGNKILGSIPVIGTLYKAFKQLTDVLLRDQHEYRQVVLVPFHQKGIYSMGLVTGQTAEILQPNNPQNYVNVFLPTTPNPTSGYYLQVPKTDLIPLDISVEEALQTIISAGVANPEQRDAVRIQHPGRPDHKGGPPGQMNQINPQEELSGKDKIKEKKHDS